MNKLEKAISFDSHITSHYPVCNDLTERLFAELSKHRRFRNKTRAKQTLKQVVINLWISYRTGLPIRYSRNRNDYTVHERYGKLHIRYKRLIPIIDALEKLGYIEQKIGFLDRTKNLGRQTRMYPTEKLRALFEEAYLQHEAFLHPDPLDELIQLKDNNKVKIDYKDTEHIKEMRGNLFLYNQFIRSQKVNVNAPGDITVSLGFLYNLIFYIMKGYIEINGPDDINLTICGDILNSKSLDTNNEIIKVSNHNCQFTDDNNDIYFNRKTNDNSILPIHTSHDNSQYFNSTHNLPSNFIMYNLSNYNIYEIHNPKSKSIPIINYHNQYFIYLILSSMTKTLSEDEIWEKRPISDFGLIGLRFQSKHQGLHRVFNNGTFELGGRFYGALHQSLPKELRACMRINGQPTVELDYSALHIRMLYHMEGIDYRDDPYEALCSNKGERKIYKLVQLVSINSDDEKQAIMAIRKELRENRIPFDITNNSLIRCLQKFKDVHKPIAKYLNTGIGLELQNLDSQIAERVLMAMTERQIPCLPVHDSFIVPVRHEAKLREAMVRSYTEVMGFKPLVDRAYEPVNEELEFLRNSGIGIC